MKRRCCSRSRYPAVACRGEEQGECYKKQRMGAKICKGGLLLLELQGQLESSVEVDGDLWGLASKLFSASRSTTELSLASMDSQKVERQKSFTSRLGAVRLVVEVAVLKVTLPCSVSAISRSQIFAKSTSFLF
ncbi:hypothetical protein GW17_00056020 [Ensete ventricosum]|nr:hypothetical protein GW17_00056020 [Ensete ventricosum]